MLEEVGWVQSVILNRRTGRLVDGHLRIELAIKNKEELVPVTVVDLSEDEEDAILASFDPISAMAKINHDALSALVAGIKTTNPALRDLIERIKKQSCIASDHKGEDAAVAEKDGSGISIGDIFQLGDHRLMCGSSADRQHMKILCGDALASLMVTDPPYGVDYGSVEEMRHDCTENCATRPGIAGDKNIGEARVLWDYAFSNVISFLKDGAPFYCFGPQGPNFFSLADSLNEAGLECHQQIVWVKNRFVFGRSDYKYQHEAIIYGWKKGAHPWYGGGNEVSVWPCDAPTKSELHPTQKPVPLYERAIINSSELGEWVLEPFGGSGTAVIACENKKRKCLCMEIDPGFCASIIGRWKDLTGLKAVKI